MRFAAQIVRQCGFVAWGLCGGSFSMCARVETGGYARAVWRWVQIRSRIARARRMNGGAVEATMLGGKALIALLARRMNGGAADTAFWLAWLGNRRAMC